MRAYSVDLRRKVVEAVLGGMPKAQAARIFGIGISTVKRYVDKAHKGEGLAPKRPPGKKRKPALLFGLEGEYLLRGRGPREGATVLFSGRNPLNAYGKPDVPVRRSSRRFRAFPYSRAASEIRTTEFHGKNVSLPG